MKCCSPIQSSDVNINFIRELCQRLKRKLNNFGRKCSAEVRFIIINDVQGRPGPGLCLKGKYRARKL